MRYATVNQEGRIVGIFMTQPELLEHRPLKTGEHIVECPYGTLEDMYYNGTEIVERQTFLLDYVVSNNIVTMNNLPNNTSIRVIGGNGIELLSVSGNTQITLNSGMNLLEIDPWPYLHTRIIVNVE
jgi:hypothetical protein